MLLIITRRDAAIVRTHTRAEGMRRHVEAAALKIEAQPRGHVTSQLLLRGNRIASLDDFHFGLPAAIGDFRDERHQLFPQPRESLGYLRRKGLRLIVI